MLPRRGTDVAHAAALLRGGGVVAFPTETVYGLGALATHPEAVERVYRIKGRPRAHPLILHGDTPAFASQWASLEPGAQLLMQAFWPGPLTLLLPALSGVCDAAFLGSQAVGLRVPSHPMAQALLAAVGGAVAAPSANRFGAISPTTAEHVAADLGDEVDYILDGGAAQVGIESTIVDLSGASGEGARLVRPGSITREALAQVIGELRAPERKVAAPGVMPSHYAPRARFEVVHRADLVARVTQLAEEGLHVAILGRHDDPWPALDALRAQPEQAPWPRAVLPEEPAALAAQLYAAMRELDQPGVDCMIATLPEGVGVGEAVVDRLSKAAGPRHEITKP